MNTPNSPTVNAMIDGHRADSARRRQRVLAALDHAAESGEELSVSGIARRAGVDRTFLYRHRDLLERIHTAETQPPNTPGTGPAVTRASLHADLLAAQQRCARMTARIQQLETRLSEMLGEHAWRASGLGAPTDIEQLQHRIAFLEQQAVDLRLQLDGRDQELAAAPRRQPRTHDPTQRHQTHRMTPTAPACTTRVALDSLQTQPRELRKCGDPSQPSGTTPRETGPRHARLPHPDRGRDRLLRTTSGRDRGLKSERTLSLNKNRDLTISG